MEQRVSLVTLGVADLPAARRFYESLGWRCNTDPELDVAFIQAGGMVLALWSRASLAEDSVVTDSGGWGGVTLDAGLGEAGAVDVGPDHRVASRVAARDVAHAFGRHVDGLEADLVALEEDARAAQREQQQERAAGRILVALAPARREMRIVVTRRMPQRRRAGGIHALRLVDDRRERLRREGRVQEREIHGEL